MTWAARDAISGAECLQQNGHDACSDWQGAVIDQPVYSLRPAIVRTVAHK